MFPNKKDSIITKVFTKKLTYIADPVLYQYYQHTYLVHIFYFEIGIFFFSSLSTYSGVYLFETFSTKEVGKIELMKKKSFIF